MTKNIRLLISKSTNAYFNLAVEESIFKKMDPKQKVLFLWQNDHVVVIGRGQNPWKECNTRLMERDSIILARRHSGGGAVFQDLGNSCFTFMAGKPTYNRKTSTDILVKAMHKLNIPAIAQGRNDLVIDRENALHKISGSAFKESKDRGFHHGTLLLNVNLDLLTRYLNPDPKKLAAKGITSVRSRVMNISELYPHLTNNDLNLALMNAFFSHYGESTEPEYISPEKMPDIPGFKEQFDKQKSWEWNFGASMKFSHTLSERFDWGNIDLHLNIDDGRITEAKLYSDSLNLDPLEDLEKLLVGHHYVPASLPPIFETLQRMHPTATEELLTLKRWMIHEMS